MENTEIALYQRLSVTLQRKYASYALFHINTPLSHLHIMYNNNSINSNIVNSNNNNNNTN